MGYEAKLFVVNEYKFNKNRKPWAEVIAMFDVSKIRFNNNAQGFPHL